MQNLNRKAGYRKETGLFTVEGVRMFAELPQERIREVLVSESFYRSCDAAIREKIDGAPYELVADEVFASAGDTRTPQGILAAAEQSSYELAELFGGTAVPHLLILETIQDPGNLGTMMRAGEGAGLTGIIMNRETVDIYNPKVIRATMGSIFRVPFYVTDRLPETIGAVRRAGIRTFAACLDGSHEYDSADFTGPSAFLIGNEAAGLSEQTAGLADERIRIPMCGRVESLNAAVAASVLMFELARQRRNPGQALQSRKKGEHGSED